MNKVTWAKKAEELGFSVASVIMVVSSVGIILEQAKWTDKRERDRNNKICEGRMDAYGMVMLNCLFTGWLYIYKSEGWTHCIQFKYLVQTIQWMGS